LLLSAPISMTEIALGKFLGLLEERVSRLERGKIQQ
jgi:hypothetical protein